MKLHLGCGEKFIPGFVHVDIQKYKNVDFVADVSKLDFLEDDSIDLIYACHLLEHFGRHKVEDVLKEWFRVLKRGGVLRLSVPDFESVVLRYINTKNIQELIGLVCGGQRNEYDYHKIIFDEKSLTERLLKIGFSHVSRYDWRKTESAHIDDYSQTYLPHMDKTNGQLMSLNIEATK